MPAHLMQRNSIVDAFEQGEIGPDLFRKACEFGLEGLVSKHKDRPYSTGRPPHWVKVKKLPGKAKA
jgi:bifunctional non-homologous end joining protein LigD